METLFNFLFEILSKYWPFILTFIFGAFVAFVELITRHNTSVSRVFSSFWAILYIIFNGIISLICLFMLINFGFFSIESTNEAKTLLQVIAAGFGSMSLLRSTLITVKQPSGTEKNIGPIKIIEIFLKFIEDEFNKHNSSINLKAIKAIMGKVDIQNCFRDISSTCLNFSEGLTQDVQKKLAEDIHTWMNKEGISDKIRAINIGIVIAKVTGENLLKEVINTLDFNEKSDLTFAQEELKQITESLEEGTK